MKGKPLYDNMVGGVLAPLLFIIGVIGSIIAGLLAVGGSFETWYFVFPVLVVVSVVLLIRASFQHAVSLVEPSDDEDDEDDGEE